MFGKPAVAAARQLLRDAEPESRVPVLIEVVDSLGGRAIEQAALDGARKAGDTGIYLLIAKQEKRLWLLVRRQFAHRLPQPAQDAVREAMLAKFKAGQLDEGLTAGAEELAKGLKATAPSEPTTGLVTRDHLKLSLAGARVILSAAEAKAVAMDKKMNIAVVDEGGHLIAFSRMDGARPASAATAQTKAISAATFRQPSGPSPTGANPPDTLLSLAITAAAADGGGRITALLGGVPIEVEGQIIGAVGVGGGTGEQDAEVARAGIAALLESLSHGAPKADEKP